MKSKDKVILIQEYFDEILPNASCELTYKTDYGFLISVMLSAQCTDKRVNIVTDSLFSKYQTLEELDKANLEDIEKIIKSLGLYKRKAKNIKGITHKLINNFNGEVPSSKEDLLTLDGVSNKTSNVVRCEIFKIPEFPVDTHVERLAKRFELAKPNDDVLTVENKLRKAFPKEKWIKLHHQFIHFGRYYCKAINPQCENCKLQSICKYYKNSLK